MDEGIKDVRGRAIFVGCKVSDGVIGGTVTAVDERQCWFSVEAGFGRYARLRGKAFNKPENLMVISDEVWKKALKDK